MDISIFTLTMGREKYLRRLIETIRNNHRRSLSLEHHIAFQGVEPSPELESFLSEYRDSTGCNLVLHLWPENCGTGEACNRLVPLLEGRIIIKFDEDAALCSEDFFTHMMEINRVEPDVVFSPFPVGLIGAVGGPMSTDRYVKYGAETDTYYTFRVVRHVGGFARITPAHTIKSYHWPNDLNECTSGIDDVNFSKYCCQTGIKMCYLENGLIVEHQESSLGQLERYKAYFTKQTIAAQKPLPIRAIRKARRIAARFVNLFRG